MYKFFVDQSQINNNKIEIIGEDVNHIKNVLRLKNEDTIIVCNKASFKSFLCVIKQIQKELIMCKIQEELKISNEPNTYIHIFQGLPKANKFEWIIEKCTEIGVKEISPIIMQRTIIKLNEKDEIKKLERWKKIAEVSSKQSKRDYILRINPIINFEDIFKKLINYDIVMVAYENEKENSLKKILKTLSAKNNKIAVIVGPEGGIDENEIVLLKKNNVIPITLGNRILRTETAPMVIASNILYELEE